MHSHQRSLVPSVARVLPALPAQHTLTQQIRSDSFRSLRPKLSATASLLRTAQRVALVTAACMRKAADSSKTVLRCACLAAVVHSALFLAALRQPTNHTSFESFGAYCVLIYGLRTNLHSAIRFLSAHSCADLIPFAVGRAVCAAAPRPSRHCGQTQARSSAPHYSTVP